MKVTKSQLRKFIYETIGDGFNTNPVWNAGKPGPVPATRRNSRPLWEIAKEIRKLWTKPNFAAIPYLDAMMELNTVDDDYYLDPGRDIVNYFLSNATTWRGPDAIRIKGELKAALLQ